MPFAALDENIPAEKEKKKVAFVLFHTGETRALRQTMLSMAKKKHYEITIIALGEAAKNSLPEALKELTKFPSFFRDCSNQNFQKEFSPENIQEIVNLCDEYNNIVIGYPARIQEQVAQALPAEKNRIIYFDVFANFKKLDVFVASSDLLVFTSEKSQHEAQAYIENLNADRKPELIAARHGDLDVWIDNYKKMTDEDKEEIRKKLLGNLSEIILWTGGYGEAEKAAFKNFIEPFKKEEIKNYYQLIITVHPGVKAKPEEEVRAFYQECYRTPLKEVGFCDAEINKMMTSLDSSQVASVVLGVFSAGSTCAQFARFIARSRIVRFNEDKQLFEGVKEIRDSNEMCQLLFKWQKKGRRQIGENTLQKVADKLGVPAESTKRTIKHHLR